MPAGRAAFLIQMMVRFFDTLDMRQAAVWFMR